MKLANWILRGTQLAVRLGLDHKDTLLALSKRVRVDAQQQFTSAEQAQGRANLGIDQLGGSSSYLDSASITLPAGGLTVHALDSSTLAPAGSTVRLGHATLTVPPEAPLDAQAFTVNVHLNQAAFQASAPPILTFQVPRAFADPAGRIPLGGEVIPDASHVTVQLGNVALNGTLHYAARAPQGDQLAPWQLHAGGSQNGDTLLSTEGSWVPHQLLSVSGPQRLRTSFTVPQLNT